MPLASRGIRYHRHQLSAVINEAFQVQESCVRSMRLKAGLPHTKFLAGCGMALMASLGSEQSCLCPPPLGGEKGTILAPCPEFNLPEAWGCDSGEMLSWSPCAL